MDDVPVPWSACRSCKRGRIELLTSVRVCDACLGTGVDLSDARLAVPIESLLALVRTRKYLTRRGVQTLGQLLRFRAEGKLAADGLADGSIAADVDRLLRACGLPVGVAGQ